jgi:hypothetical protein
MSRPLRILSLNSMEMTPFMKLRLKVWGPAGA